MQALADALNRHLTDRLLATATPGIRLRHAGPGDPVAGHLGGHPPLPPGTSWPGSDEDDPLTFLLGLDLAALPPTGLDLPKSGWLLFFRSENDDDYGAVYWFDEPTAATETPHDLVLPHVDVTAVVEPTWPSFANPAFPDVPGDLRPVHSTLPVHRIGGFGEGVQYEPEYAPDMAPLLARETELPVLLAQIDTDYEARIGWGDVGNSHWVIGRDALAARRFEEVELYWSCF